jgi:shikimate kinase
LLEAKPMLINLNGWPGAGKLTVGRIIAHKLQGHLLDNHTIFNVASAVTRPGTPQFYETARAVRRIAFDRILELPANIPVVLTNVVARGGTSGFLEENWRAILTLAEHRRCDLYSATLFCSPEEKRPQGCQRGTDTQEEMQDPAALADVVRARALFDEGATYRESFDNTNLTAGECADQIVAWVSSRP